MGNMVCWKSVKYQDRMRVIDAEDVIAGNTKFYEQMMIEISAKKRSIKEEKYRLFSFCKSNRYTTDPAACKQEKTKRLHALRELNRKLTQLERRAETTLMHNRMLQDMATNRAHNENIRATAQFLLRHKIDVDGAIEDRDDIMEEFATTQENTEALLVSVDPNELSDLELERELEGYLIETDLPEVSNNHLEDGGTGVKEPPETIAREVTLPVDAPGEDTNSSPANVQSYVMMM
jgi:hypothetical protein